MAQGYLTPKEVEVIERALHKMRRQETHLDIWKLPYPVRFIIQHPEKKETQADWV